jgi:ACR3 family arsenite transporter
MLVKETLEHRQVWIYFASVIAGGAAAAVLTGTDRLEILINPALALMLFVTFLQVPLADIGNAFREVRFLSALLASNFVAVPMLALLLLALVPDDPLVRLGVLMVLLTPCIDYVITFAQLGRADARLLLASTPLLLAVQMALLPLYLAVILGEEGSTLVQVEPFLHAFLWLIAVPLALAAIVQAWASRSTSGRRVATGLGVLPVPATAVVLFIVVAATVPILENSVDKALGVIPAYLAFAVLAPLIGLAIGKAFRLGPRSTRAVAFSSATRNSLVVLPLALAVPDAVPVLPAVIVTQTLVELVSELVYVRVLPLLGRSTDPAEHTG